MTAHRSKSGTIYLIHFERKHHRAQHYIGFALDLSARLDQHRAGHGSKLIAAINALGIGWAVVRTWKGDRNFERRLHDSHEGPRLCPICRSNLGLDRKPTQLELIF